MKEVKSSVSSGTPGTRMKSSAGSKLRAIAPNTAARSRGSTLASTSTMTLVSESCPVPIRPSAVFFASLAKRFSTATTSRLWKPASKYAHRSRISGWRTLSTPVNISCTASPMNLSSWGGLPTTLAWKTGRARWVMFRT